MIRSIEKSNNLIGNRTIDFPAYSAVPQPTTLPLALYKKGAKIINVRFEVSTAVTMMIIVFW
jgi:hypothetical protein